MVNDVRKLIEGTLKLRAAVTRILVGNDKGEASFVSVTGDLTLGSAGSFVIGTGAVTAAKLQYSNVSITIAAATVGTTSAVVSQAFTVGAKILNLYLYSVSGLICPSFYWKAEMAASGSLIITVNHSNPGDAAETLIFKGIVLEP
jgi:hypothetical protein